MRAIDQANVISYANGSKGTGEYSGKYYFPTLEKYEEREIFIKKSANFCNFWLKKVKICLFPQKSTNLDIFLKKSANLDTFPLLKFYNWGKFFTIFFFGFGENTRSDILQYIFGETGR